jgi:maleylacetoacetate isomerase
MQLYSYWRSTSSYRIRIALALKRLEYEYISVNLNNGEQHDPAYRKIHSDGQVPSLVDGETIIHQTAGIVEYLEEVYPDPSLFPENAAGRARVRGFILACVAEMQGRTGRRVRDYLLERYGMDDLKEWYGHWAVRNLELLEKLVAGHPDTGKFFHGDQPGAADCFLVPALYNLRLRETNLDQAPTLVRIEQNCLTHPAFKAAAPENQIDVAPDTRY